MRLATALLLSTLLAGAAWAEPKTYTVDAKKSELVVFLYKAGVAARMAHDHVIAATTFEGSIVFDPADPASFKASVTAQADSLAVDPPELVKKYKLSSSPSESDRKTIKATLEGEGQLHVKKHPTISFVSSGVRRVKDDLYLEGTFTLRGVKKPVRCLMTLTFEKGVLRGQARFRIKQSDFGYEPYSAFLGAVKVKDTAQIQVDLVARPAKEAKSEEKAQ